ncbi:MAG: class I SAM-dependent RNA methyltransferase [Candidatus Gracilibacteria bacterium]|nr:class I SAM-dependent RNA methyltransferase [Candidatus Gracilibacteria bacterium]MDD3120486.1 class I SAM-dependent RNA methyltransferase [Candidatus Gracilibacteria bacterium]MDD4530528.1 class I SAM-dependent RNA methyltransferase [Candidatus Gracilibacteria bacterium]
MYNGVITCIAGVESLVKKEIEMAGYKVTETEDRLVFWQGDDSAIAKLNLWSRCGNKVYLELAKKRITNFDMLFDLIKSIDWKHYVPENNPITVNAVSVKSGLESIPSIQSVSKKAIVEIKTGSRNGIMKEEQKLTEIEILVFIKDDFCRILLDTSGNALHKRGYRSESGEAPIKESLAASLVLLSSWRFGEPLLDPFCGSGTIVIEAGLIARNIAPGLNRSFTFENFSWYNKKYLEQAKIEAQSKIIRDKQYTITGSDIDENMVEIARRNVIKAGLKDTIKIETKDVKEYLDVPLTGTIVSNPPYGIRLRVDLNDIYKTISLLFLRNKTLNGGLITSYFDFDKIIKMDDWKKRKLYNGNEMCYLYKKKV